MSVPGGRTAPGVRLARLFWLLQENPEATSRELAERLGLSSRNIALYKRRLSERLERNGGGYPCPECGSWAVREAVGGLICHSCGLVVEETPSLSKNLPFDETYAWVSHLAFNKSLGDTLPANRVWQVLQHNGKRDLPVRAQAAAKMAYSDPPPIRRLLETGSRLMKSLGLDADTSRNHILADSYGRLLRKLGALIQVGGFTVNGSGIARAALYQCLLKFGFQLEAEKLRESFDMGHLEFVSFVEELERRARANTRRLDLLPPTLR
jgi:ribosomal protein L37AE/L43A